MAVRDEGFEAIPTLTEADGGLWSPPMAAPASAPRDWRSLCEQAQARAEAERARADAAEARVTELLVAERTARSRAGQLNAQLDKSRNKLKAAVEEIKEVRRAAKDALFYRSEVARLEKLLSEAGVDSRKRSTIVSLRMEVFQLREALQAVQARKGTTAPASAVKSGPPTAAPAPKRGKDAPGALREVVVPLTRKVRELERENARAEQGAGAPSGAEGGDRDASQEGRGAASPVERSGKVLVAPESGRPAAQGAGTGAEAEGTRSRRCAGKSLL